MNGYHTFLSWFLQNTFAKLEPRNMATGSNTEISFWKAAMMHQDFFISRNLDIWIPQEKNEEGLSLDIF